METYIYDVFKYRHYQFIILCEIYLYPINIFLFAIKIFLSSKHNYYTNFKTLSYATVLQNTLSANKNHVKRLKIKEKFVTFLVIRHTISDK